MNIGALIPKERIKKGLWWGKALTLVEGCTEVSEACTNCWAAAQTHMRSKQNNPKIKARYSGLTNKKGHFTGKIRVMEDALKIPASIKKPTVFAVWNDLFHRQVANIIIEHTLQEMAKTPRHVFLALTKRPERVKHFILSSRFYMEGLPPNVWIGTTVENQEVAHVRAKNLYDIRTWTPNIFFSIEPLLGPLDKSTLEFLGSFAKWIIVGGESGPNARFMDVEWARTIRDSCLEHEVPFFFKQWSGLKTRKSTRLLDGVEWSQFPSINNLPEYKEVNNG